MTDSPPSVAAPDAAAVRAWLAAVRSDLSEVVRKMEPLVAEQNRLRAREQLLVSLLHGLEHGAAPEPKRAPTKGPIALPASSDESPDASAADIIAASGSVRDYVWRGVRAVLSDSAGPLHINDLHARFIARGLRVPGAGRPANLTAHLTRCPGVTSPRRGFYALAPETENPSAVAPEARRSVLEFTSRKRSRRRQSRK